MINNNKKVGNKLKYVIEFDIVPLKVSPSQEKGFALKSSKSTNGITEIEKFPFIIVVNVLATGLRVMSPGS